MREALALGGHRLSIDEAAHGDIALFPVGVNVFSHAWRGLLKELGIVDLRFHDLRHEATSRLFERGLTAAEVMSITGHSTNAMVDRYAHYSSLLVLQRLEASGPATPMESGAMLGSLAAQIPRFI